MIDLKNNRCWWWWRWLWWCWCWCCYCCCWWWKWWWWRWWWWCWWWWRWRWRWCWCCCCCCWWWWWMMMNDDDDGWWWWWYDIYHHGKMFYRFFPRRFSFSGSCAASSSGVLEVPSGCWASWTMDHWNTAGHCRGHSGPIGPRPFHSPTRQCLAESEKNGSRRNAKIGKQV